MLRPWYSLDISLTWPYQSYKQAASIRRISKPFKTQILRPSRRLTAPIPCGNYLNHGSFLEGGMWFQILWEWDGCGLPAGWADMFILNSLLIGRMGAACRWGGYGSCRGNVDLLQSVPKSRSAGGLSGSLYVFKKMNGPRVSRCSPRRGTRTWMMWCQVSPVCSSEPSRGNMLQDIYNKNV